MGYGVSLLISFNPIVGGSRGLDPADEELPWIVADAVLGLGSPGEAMTKVLADTRGIGRHVKVLQPQADEVTEDRCGDPIRTIPKLAARDALTLDAIAAPDFWPWRAALAYLDEVVKHHTVVIAVYGH